MDALCDAAALRLVVEDESGLRLVDGDGEADGDADGLAAGDSVGGALRVARLEAVAVVEAVSVRLLGALPVSAAEFDEPALSDGGALAHAVTVDVAEPGADSERPGDDDPVTLGCDDALPRLVGDTDAQADPVCDADAPPESVGCGLVEPAADAETRVDSLARGVTLVARLCELSGLPVVVADAVGEPVGVCVPAADALLAGDEVVDGVADADCVLQRVDVVDRVGAALPEPVAVCCDDAVPSEDADDVADADRSAVADDPDDPDGGGEFVADELAVGGAVVDGATEAVTVEDAERIAVPVESALSDTQEELLPVATVDAEPTDEAVKSAEPL